MTLVCGLPTKDVARCRIVSSKFSGSNGMPEISVNSFLKVLQTTEVLPEQRVAELEREFADQENAQSLAAHLVKTGELTAWQAKFLLSGRDDLLIGKYVLRERLSQNELGDRMLAIHYNLDRQVDLQILPASAQSETPEFEAFLRQASDLARLCHPNLIHVYDIDRDRGRYYLVCEHFDGATLEQVASVETFALTDLASITRQFLRGLQYSHQNQVVHGNIGVDSLMVASSGIAKVGNLAMTPLRKAFGSADASAGSTNPVDDYTRCVRIVLSMMKAKPDLASTISFQEFDSIVRPLASSATEEQVDGALQRLDQWLERYRPNELSSDSSISLAAVAVLVPPQPASEVPPAPPKPKRARRKKLSPAQLGQIAAAISGVLLLGFVGWRLLQADGGSSNPRLAVASKEKDSTEKLSQLRDKQLGRRSSESPANEDAPNTEAAPKPEVAPTRRVPLLQNPQNRQPTEMNLDPLTGDESSSVPSELDSTTAFKLPEPSTSSEPTPTTNVPSLRKPRVRQQLAPPDSAEGANPDAQPSSSSVTDSATESAADPNIAATVPPAEALPKETAPVTAPPLRRQRVRQQLAPPDPAEADPGAQTTQPSTQEVAPAPPADPATTPDDSAKPADDPAAEPAGESANPLAESAQPAASVAAGPFAATPVATDLPATNDTSEIVLGQVHTGDKYLLACSLVSDDRVTRRTQFTLERAAGDEAQSWTFIGDTSTGEPTRIAQLTLVDADLKFRWEADAARDPSFGYLRNCLLRMQVGSETFLLRLRKPVAMGSAKVSGSEPEAKLSFELDAVPFEEGLVVVEFLGIPDAKFADSSDDFSFFVEPGDQIIPARDPLFVYMTERSERYVFLELEAKIAKKAELIARLRIHQEPKPKTYSDKLSGEAEAYLQRVASEVTNTYAQAKAYVAPYGEKTRHKENVSDLKKMSEKANDDVVQFGLQKRRLSAIYSKPIQVRMYFMLADQQVELATWDGQPTRTATDGTASASN